MYAARHESDRQGGIHLYNIYSIVFMGLPYWSAQDETTALYMAIAIERVPWGYHQDALGNVSV